MITYGRITRACRGQAYDAVFRGPDVNLVKECVNQGIDSHLEACSIEGRDSYELKYGGPVSGMELRCRISPESLPVLLRRMVERGTEHAWYLASDILGTLEINDQDFPPEIGPKRPRRVHA